MLKLQFKDRRREAVWLVDQTFTIGKNAQNSLMINDGSILDFHAEIINQGNKLVLVDKSAGKGSWVNNKVVTSHSPLSKNDVLKFGNVELILIDPKENGAANPLQTQSRPAESAWAIHSKASWLEQSRYNIANRVVIGRDPACDIALPLDHLSRQHCALEVKGGQFHVQDLGSSNGTFVNGERITSTTVQPGDKIKLDVVTFDVIGPSHDPNKTIIRTAPAASGAQAKAAKPAAKGQTKPKSTPTHKASPKPKKLAADGKQDWISGDNSHPESSGKAGLIIGVIVVIGIAIGAGVFLM